MRRSWTMRGMIAVAWFAVLAGCTLTVSLDGLTGGEPKPDGGTSSSGGAGGASSSTSAGGTSSSNGDGGTAGGGGSGGTTPDAGCEASYVAAILNDHPVLFQRLGDPGITAVDASGNGLDGTYGSAVSRDRPGILDGCDRGASFPGDLVAVSKAVKTPRDPRLEPSAAFSIEAWFNMSTVPPMLSPETNPAIVAYGDDGSGAAYTMDIDAAGPVINFYLKLAPSSDAGPSYALVGYHGMTILEAHRAYHAVVTYENNSLSLYLDGNLDGQFTNQGSGPKVVGYDTAGLAIGADPAFSTRYAFDGTIEDVAIYDKALTPQQVTDHFLATGP